MGDALTLLTDRSVQFPVAGVAVDYDVRPTIFMHEPVFRHWWDDGKISAAGLFVQDGADVDEMAAEIRSALAGRAELVVRSNRGMRHGAGSVRPHLRHHRGPSTSRRHRGFYRHFEHVDELAVGADARDRRAAGDGHDARQLWRLSLLETGLIGGSAGLLALPMGLVLALVLIYIINLRSFGWSLEMRLDPWEFVQAFAVALGAALLAGVYPAWRMARAQPANAVRAE